MRPRPTAPRIEILPPEIRRLMQRSFVEGYTRPALRPSAEEWAAALEKAEAGLVQCRQVASHWYARHLRRCPWCEASQPRVQSPLPALRGDSFKPAAAVPPLPAGFPPQPAPALPRLDLQANHQTPVPAGSFAIEIPSPGGRRPPRRLIRWLGPSGYRPKMNLRFWWKNTRVGTLTGTGSGLALAGLVWVVFTHPLPTSFVLGSLASLTVTALGVWLSFFRFSLPRRMRPALAWTLRSLVLILFVALAIVGWPLIDTLAAAFLSVHHAQAGWLVLDGLTLGAGVGCAYATFRLFMRYKNLLFALVATLAVAALPVVILVLVGAFEESFK